uniref:C-type lectin domain-containing protein n=1 Tax=Myripristis murdjan TaxID=586833 RepID=A0A667XEC2_9TELE
MHAIASSPTLLTHTQTFLHFQFYEKRDALTKERDQLKASSNNLMTEKDQLQSHYDTVSASRDALQLEVDRLKLVQNCPQGWEKFGCSCYYISSGWKTWNESRDDCANKGAHLVIINSREEQAFLNKFAVRAWIGLSDGEDEGKWKWVDGSPLVGEGFWQNGEPNDENGREDCAELISGVGEWNDMPCMHRQRWICEKVIKN